MRLTAQSALLLSVAVGVVVVGCNGSELGEAILRLARQPYVVPTGFHYGSSDDRNFWAAATVANIGWKDMAEPVEVQMQIRPIVDSSYPHTGGRRPCQYDSTQVLDKVVVIPASPIIKGGPPATKGGAVNTTAALSFMPCRIGVFHKVTIIVDPMGKVWPYLSPEDRTFEATRLGVFPRETTPGEELPILQPTGFLNTLETNENGEEFHRIAAALANLGKNDVAGPFEVSMAASTSSGCLGSPENVYHTTITVPASTTIQGVQSSQRFEGGAITTEYGLKFKNGPGCDRMHLSIIVDPNDKVFPHVPRMQRWFEADVALRP